MKELVIVAHPDDEVLGCGGTMVRRASEGVDVYVAILGEGMTSRSDERCETDKDLLKTLQSHSHRAAKLLGTKETFQYDFPDNSFDTVPMLEIVKVVEELVNKVRPERIYTHHIVDLNIDHMLTCRAVLTATRPLAEQCVEEVLSCEIPSSTEWLFGNQYAVFQPNVFIDISETLEMKIQAMLEYETEVRAYPHPRSPEALRVIAQRWGSVSGFKAAEAFTLLRSLR